MSELAGKIALITGGNSGIALASAKAFVGEGAYVFITGRRATELDTAVKEMGRNVTGVLGDVSRLGDLDRLFAQIRQEKGRLDILFANAGVAKYSALGEITEDLYEELFSINVKGLLFTIQKALPLLPDGAAIILTSSGWDIRSIERAEINEAFAAIAIVVARELGLPEDTVNVQGGAVAHGHPIGATGAVLTTKLIQSMRRDGLTRGLVTLCIAGGQGIALAIEALH